MAPSSRLMEKGKNILADLSKDPAKMLLYTATIGWVLSAISQVAAIAINDKISKKEKRFLIPQETADAALNIISFFAVTLVLQNLTKSFVSKGKILTPKIQEGCKKFGIRMVKNADGDAANIGKDISAKLNEYQSVLDIHKAENIISDNAKIQDINKKIEGLTHLKEEVYNPFEGGLKMAGNILGGIISSNIITPALRNPIAANKQRASIEREQLEHDAKLYNENKVILAQYRVSKQNLMKNPAFTPYFSGSMKV